MIRHRLALLLTILVTGTACGPKRPPAPTPLQVSPEQFKALHWLEGRWRGTDGILDPFYEEYRFINDSSIRSYSFADSTLIQIEDSAMIVLSGGMVTSLGENSSWVVTGLSATSVAFEPRRNATNKYTWASASDSAWTSTLSWYDSDGDPHQRVYTMQRLSR